MLACRTDYSGVTVRQLPIALLQKLRCQFDSVEREVLLSSAELASLPTELVNKARLLAKCDSCHERAQEVRKNKLALGQNGYRWTSERVAQTSFPSVLADMVQVNSRITVRVGEALALRPLYWHDIYLEQYGHLEQVDACAMRSCTSIDCACACRRSRRRLTRWR